MNNCMDTCLGLYGTMSICRILYRNLWNLLSSVWKSIDFRTTSMETMCVYGSLVLV